jgi:hypothetical protein
MLSSPGPPCRTSTGCPKAARSSHSSSSLEAKPRLHPTTHTSTFNKPELRNQSHHGQAGDGARQHFGGGQALVSTGGGERDEGRGGEGGGQRAGRSDEGPAPRHWQPPSPSRTLHALVLHVAIRVKISITDQTRLARWGSVHARRPAFNHSRSAQPTAHSHQPREVAT